LVYLSYFVRLLPCRRLPAGGSAAPVPPAEKGDTVIAISKTGGKMTLDQYGR